jgi:glycosyltransferase involved in cell wall biosynthesis
MSGVKKLVLTHNTARYVFMHYRQLIARFVQEGIEVVCVVPTDPAVADIQALGARCVPYKVSRRGMNPLGELATLAALTRIFRRERPDAVFNFSIKPVIYGAFAARLAGVGRVFSMVTGLGYVFMNGGPLRSLVRALVKLKYRVALGLCERVFFQNGDDRGMFVDRGLVGPEKTVVLNGSGIDTAEYAPEEEGAAEPGAFILVGRLLRDKGILEYAAAARRLRSRYPDARFRVLGPLDSNPAAVDPRELQAWQAEGAIEYLGETDDVRPQLAKASVFVLPSYREGLPRATLEAMAMAKPVVTTDAPGCRETVVEGVNGFLVPVGDADALEAAMERFLRSPELAESMGRAARRLAEERFDVHRVNETIVSTILSDPVGP